MEASRKWDDPLGIPHLPECPDVSIDNLSLASVRDVMTSLAPEVRIERAILRLVEEWLVNSTSVEPIQSIRSLMDSIRSLPRGDERLKCMNSLVRTLGQPQVLATFLDMIRDSAGRTGTREQELSRISQKTTQHCIYGWTGQTLLVTSSAEPTKGTLEPETGVAELLGEVPPEVWGLSMHIWQPNPRAKGFASGASIERGIIVEPPHSHPFDFASMLAIGGMHQSIYAQRRSNSDLVEPIHRGHRYAGTTLQHVYGVWPPHDHRLSSEVMTLEERVSLRAGDSYYMTCDRIHDVEIDANIALDRPAITLFLASECVVKPHVYMAPSMADFHDAHPKLKHRGYALPSEDWHAKLELASAYLRGKALTLNLHNVVKWEGEYAFFHA